VRDEPGFEFGTLFNGLSIARHVSIHTACFPPTMGLFFVVHLYLLFFALSFFLTGDSEVLFILVTEASRKAPIIVTLTMIFLVIR
jgi:hypothetical protein